MKGRRTRPASSLPTIGLDRFYRGSTGHATGLPCNGLGLAIVKQMVEKHKGQLAVENDSEGHGTIFTVWLPVERAPEVGLSSPRLFQIPELFKAVGARSMTAGWRFQPGARQRP
ncbi:MAG: ATP-binding protein [Anaerolineales bacterium]